MDNGICNGGGFTCGVEHDVLFLDIEREGHGHDMDGMKMARQIKGMEDTKQPIIIFITGYEKYVYDAFDVGGFQPPRPAPGRIRPGRREIPVQVLHKRQTAFRLQLEAGADR